MIEFYLIDQHKLKNFMERVESVEWGCGDGGSAAEKERKRKKDRREGRKEERPTDRPSRAREEARPREQNTPRQGAMNYTTAPGNCLA